MTRTNNIEMATRMGFAARGLMYLLIGYLAVRLGRTEGQTGAMEYLDSAGGRVVLFVMGVGFFAYAAWRIGEAAIDSEGQGTGAGGIVQRLGSMVSGVIHIGLSYVAFRLASGLKAGGGDMAEDGASTALVLPFGEAWVMVAAAVLLGTGAYQLVKAVKLGFLKHIDPAVANKPWVAWVGRLGYLARGTVFIVMAWFLWNASRRSDAQAAGGLDQALDAMPGSLQLLVAAGLAMFGVFSMVEARYRRITDPKVVERLKRVVA